MRARAVSCCCLSRPSSSWGSTARTTSVNRARTRASPSSPFWRNRSCAPRAANVSTDTLKRRDAAIKDSKLADYLRVTSTIIACEFRSGYTSVLLSRRLVRVRKFLAVFCRTRSAHTTVDRRKVLLALEPARHRHIQHANLSGTQHLLDALYPGVQVTAG